MKIALEKEENRDCRVTKDFLTTIRSHHNQLYLASHWEKRYLAGF
jgi:hypothetical protein